jgi:serine/threonine protein kinase
MTVKKAITYATAFNEYTQQGVIGQGGSGTVYAVSDAEGLRFALKLVDPGKTSTQKLRRFQNEVAFCQGNGHKNIITVLDSGRGPGNEPFYVMPLYETTLEKAIRAGIPPEDVLRIFGEILDGVEAAHLKQVTHRDLKPQNILCDVALARVVLADFGIARFEEEDLFTAVVTGDNERLANFQYAAPEQRTRGRDVTSKADIYALGVILNEMFTKEVLQGTGFKTIASVDGNFAYLDELVDLMVRQEPTQRPDIREVKNQLLARRNQFITQQKIDRLTREVVPESTIDDSLVRDPIRLTGADYQRGWLIFSLSQAPNPGWIEEFHNQAGVTFFMGYPPSAVTFNGDRAHVQFPQGNEAVQTQRFKDWITNATGLYAKRIERETLEKRRRQQQELAQRLQAEQERKRVLGNIGF